MYSNFYIVSFNKEVMKLSVITEMVYEPDSSRVVVNVKFPANQDKMTIPEVAHLLVGGLSMMIKGATKENCGMTDYELMGKCIEHLNSEFASATSFDDVEVNKKVFKK